jgi:hypothetical protein
VEKIKVIVASRPRLMREVVLEMISNQPDIELMAEVQEDSKIIGVVEELNPDWLFIALDHPDERPDICESLFHKFPNLKVLALAAGKNNCILYWANVTIRSSRVESSERGILDVLRGRRPIGTSGFAVTGSRKVN